MRNSRHILLLLCLGSSVSAAVQTQKPISQMPASARQLIGVKVSGSKRFAEEDIIAATGLQLGTPVNEDDFKRAARRLGDTGVFTDITYSYSYSSAGTKLAFHVVDADKFVPVRFEDFVWFSDADLLHRIVARRIAAALERHAQRREELRRRRALTELSAGKRDPTRNANRLMALAGDEQVVDEAGGAHIGYRLQMHDEIVHGLFSGSCPSRRVPRRS